MPVSIVANSAAQLAQSAIRVRSEALTVGANRLSSGLRVSNAADDVAALAVGSSLKITNKALETATLNASGAVSTLQIADGALSQIGNLMIRMQALATQASSGQNENATRTLINGEFQSLITEVDRLSRTTEFNGVKMLAGTRQFTTATASDMAASGVVDVRLDPMLINADRTFRVSYSAATESLTVTRLDAGASTSQTLDITALLDGVAGAGQNIAAGTRLEVGFASLGLTLTLDSHFDRATNMAPAMSVAAGPDMTVATPSFTHATTGVPQEAVEGLRNLLAGYSTTTGGLTLPLTTDGTNIQLGARAGISYAVNGAPATASGAASNNLTLAGPNTIDVYVDISPSGTALLGSLTTGALTTTGTTAGSLTVGVGTGLVGADYVDDNAATRLTYKVGSGIASGQDLLHVDIPAFTSAALGIDGLSVTTEMNANAAITALQTAMITLNQGRATVGAQQLRLEQIASNLGVVTTNNEAARSALLDADISKEISDYTANQALLEAGVAMLSRANQLPNILIDLLKNG